MSDGDAGWMRLAIDRAVGARGRVEPNPLVGCAIVKDNALVGVGRHERYGQAHAEPNALAVAGERATGATAYVTLEPCCHRGGEKQTPPCAPRLIDAGVARVVIGCLDPNPRVSGGGVQMLNEAGVEVEVGLLGEACRQLIAPFHARQRLGRPYVTLKWAISADGRVAGRGGRPVRITNERSDRLVQQVRGRCDAIAVGTNTLLNDDPKLTARGPNPPRSPVRVVFSNSLKLSHDRQLWRDGPQAIVYTHDAHDDYGEHVVTSLPRHVLVVRLPAHANGRGGHRFRMTDAYADLHKRGVTHLLVEPGPKLASDLIAKGLCDRVWVFRGQHAIGDDGLAATELPSDWSPVATLGLAGDTLAEYMPDGPACFGRFPSPDLAIAGAGSLSAAVAAATG